MASKNIIIGVVAVLVVAGGIWYWVSSSGTAGTPSSTASSTATGTQPAAQTTTLRALATQGGNYTCTVSTIADNGQTTGSVFTAGGKTRLDFKITLNGTDTTMHTIRTGTTAYTWVEGQSAGTKSTITTSSSIVPQPQGGVIAVNDNVQVASDCHPWSPDATKFVPPTGITFAAI